MVDLGWALMLFPLAMPVLSLPDPVAPAAPTRSAAAFDREAAALRPLVRAVVANILGEERSHPDVEDCAHDALRRAFEGKERLREGEALRGWVVGIARHVALDAIRARKRSRRRRVDEPDAGDEAAPSALERVIDPAPTPDERAAREQQSRSVHAALADLDERQRTALLLVHLEGLTYQEAAARLGVPLGTVATWVTRGRKTVAAAVGERGKGP